jgi:beta-mannosidase
MRRVEVDTHKVRELSEGWELASSAPGGHEDPSGIDGLAWRDAVVPGTVAAAIEGIPAAALDGRDWWFRTRLPADAAGPGEELALALGGIATVSEVYVGGRRLLASDSMFASHVVGIDGGDRELAICCRALAPLLAVRRRPRARWRTRLVAEGNLRFYRTMLLGRAPGFAPGPPAVGPWRPVRLELRRGVIVEALRLRPRVIGGEGVLAVSARLRAPGGAPAPRTARIELTAPGEPATGTELLVSAAGSLAGELRVPEVRLWWPHTHGDPSLYRAALIVEGGEEPARVELGSVGFRALDCGKELARDGIQITVNEVPVFARGAVWTPLELTRPHSAGARLREVLGTAAAAGMNMLRVPGIGCYESEEFYDLCDELGILVWQDFMLANLDYPDQDPGFMRTLEREARAEVERIGGRPSLAVLCGGSEVAQQVAMLGLDPALASGPIYGELLPSVATEAELDAPYIPSTPWGGDLPFRTDRGVANYYGVGAYLRGLEDARLANVRFAAEALAFANVPDEESLEDAAGLTLGDPRWKAGVPRDAGAGWDFEDVRDHYLRLLFGVDPVELRSVDPDRYLELSRTVTGEVMAEVLGEWRRAGSPCAGALVLWLTDLRPGAGWGLLDHRGRPKPALDAVRRALAPIAVWSTDEGLGGIDVHVANDGPEPLEATLRIGLYRDLEIPVGEASRELGVGPHGLIADNLESLLGRFVDVNWAYRFGTPAQDVIVMSVEQDGDDGPRLVSQAFRFPVGRPIRREPAERLGVSAGIENVTAAGATVAITSRRLLYGARVRVPGFRALEQGFSVEPGHRREVALEAISAAVPAPASGGSLEAINLDGRAAIAPEGGG